MKNIKSWENFNESQTYEPINEGLVKSIVTLPFKILGFILKPITNIVVKIILKQISVEAKWKAFENIFKAKETLALSIIDAQAKLKSDNNMSPNEKRDLQKKIDKFKKEYKEGFNFNKEKEKTIEYLEKILNKSKDDKSKEDYEWLIKKVKSLKPMKKTSFTVQELENIIVDFN